MKKIFLILTTILALINTSAFAKENAITIAIIDVEEVLKNSTVMKQVQEEISKKEKSYQEQINKKQKDLESDLKRIESKKSVLAEDALNKEKEQFSKNFNDLKSEFESKQKILKNAYAEAVVKIDEKINEIINKISKEKNIDLIIPASEVIYYDAKLDISAEVLTELNSRMKSLEVHFE